MSVLQEIRKDAIAQLEAGGNDIARLDVDLLLSAALHISSLDIILEPKRPLKDYEEADFKGLLARRLAHEPISQILGRKDFWTHSFIVSRDCLTPRPDSETVIEAALKAIPDKNTSLKILDLGTGSGCLLLSLLSELPKAQGLGVDLSPKALAIAQKNAKNLKLTERCDFLFSNWADKIPQGDKFDIILCNPPYIAENEARDLALDVRNYEPHMALFAEDNGLLAYKQLAEVIPDILADEGHVFLEIGHVQGPEVRDIFEKVGACDLTIIPDLAGRDRCVAFNFAQN